jgi:CheY-like chemotaxis protein
MPSDEGRTRNRRGRQRRVVPRPRGAPAAGPRYAVVGEAASVAEGLELVRELRPATVLADVTLPDGDGFALTSTSSRSRRRRASSSSRATRIPASAGVALRAGARGFVAKGRADGSDPARADLRAAGIAGQEAGSRTRTLVPSPGGLWTSSVPSRAATRSRSPTSPIHRPGRRRRAAVVADGDLDGVRRRSRRSPGRGSPGRA